MESIRKAPREPRSRRVVRSAPGLDDLLSIERRTEPMVSAQIVLMNRVTPASAGIEVASNSRTMATRSQQFQAQQQRRHPRPQTTRGTIPRPPPARNANSSRIETRPQKKATYALESQAP